jgi:hypothetical protein
VAALSLRRLPCSGCVAAIKINETGVAPAARVGLVLPESAGARRLVASVDGRIMRELFQSGFAGRVRLVLPESAGARRLAALVVGRNVHKRFRSGLALISFP